MQLLDFIIIFLSRKVLPVLLAHIRKNIPLLIIAELSPKKGCLLLRYRLTNRYRLIFHYCLFSSPFSIAVCLFPHSSLANHFPPGPVKSLPRRSFGLPRPPPSPRRLSPSHQMPPEECNPRSIPHRLPVRQWHGLPPPSSHH